MNGRRPVGAHLVGSVPLRNAGEVMRTVANVLDDRLDRVPDGETGSRRDWVWSQVPVLGRSRLLDRAGREWAGVRDWPVFRLAEGAHADQLELSELGYKDSALDSYRIFSDLKRRGVLHTDMRFQVGIPTPASITATFIHDDSRSAVERAYERAMEREIREMVAAIPPQELAIQWETCAEVLLATASSPVKPWFTGVWAGIADRAHQLSELIPAEVELGFHFCYGNLYGRRSIDLADARVLVELANLYTEASSRPIQFIHLPVRDDVEPGNYLRPLSSLALTPVTRLYLGLINNDRTAHDTLDRIDAAYRHAPGGEFGLATECGLGRRATEQVPALLDMHRQLTTPVRTR